MRALRTRLGHDPPAPAAPRGTAPNTRRSRLRSAFQPYRRQGCSLPPVEVHELWGPRTLRLHGREGQDLLQSVLELPGALPLGRGVAALKGSNRLEVFETRVGEPMRNTAIPGTTADPSSSLNRKSPTVLPVGSDVVFAVAARHTVPLDEFLDSSPFVRRGPRHRAPPSAR